MEEDETLHILFKYKGLFDQDLTPRPGFPHSLLMGDGQDQMMMMKSGPPRTMEEDSKREENPAKRGNLPEKLISRARMKYYVALYLYFCRSFSSF